MKTQRTMPGSVGQANWWLLVIVGMMLTMNLSFMPRAQAQSDNANNAINILKTMSDYMTSQKTLSMTFDADIEVITPDIQKIQFTSSGQVQLSRPDKLHASRTGGYVDVELVFDGKMLTVNSKNSNTFAQLDTPG